MFYFSLVCHNCPIKRVDFIVCVLPLLLWLWFIDFNICPTLDHCAWDRLQCKIVSDEQKCIAHWMWTEFFIHSKCIFFIFFNSISYWMYRKLIRYVKLFVCFAFHCCFVVFFSLALKNQQRLCKSKVFEMECVRENTEKFCYDFPIENIFRRRKTNSLTDAIQLSSVSICSPPLSWICIWSWTPEDSFIKCFDRCKQFSFDCDVI